MQTNANCIKVVKKRTRKPAIAKKEKPWRVHRKAYIFR